MINGKYFFPVIVGVIIRIKPIAQNIVFESIERSQTQTMVITLILQYMYRYQTVPRDKTKRRQVKKTQIEKTKQHLQKVK